MRADRNVGFFCGEMGVVVISSLMQVIMRFEAVINSLMAVITHHVPIIIPLLARHSQYGMLEWNTESSHKGE